MKHQFETNGWKAAGRDGNKRMRAKQRYLRRGISDVGWEPTIFNILSGIKTKTESLSLSLLQTPSNLLYSVNMGALKFRGILPDLQWKVFVIIFLSQYTTAFSEIYFEVRIPLSVCDIWVFGVVYLIKLVYTLWLPPTFLRFVVKPIASQGRVGWLSAAHGWSDLTLATWLFYLSHVFPRGALFSFLNKNMIPDTADSFQGGKCKGQRFLKSRLSNKRNSWTAAARVWAFTVLVTGQPLHC